MHYNSATFKSDQKPFMLYWIYVYCSFWSNYLSPTRTQTLVFTIQSLYKCVLIQSQLMPVSHYQAKYNRRIP